MTLVEELDRLHDAYVEAVNTAVAHDDYDRVEDLAAEYDTDAIRLIAEREGKLHLLPITRPGHADSRLRRLARRLSAQKHTQKSPAA